MAELFANKNSLLSELKQLHGSRSDTNLNEQGDQNETPVEYRNGNTNPRPASYANGDIHRSPRYLFFYCFYNFKPEYIKFVDLKSFLLKKSLHYSFGFMFVVV